MRVEREAGLRSAVSVPAQHRHGDADRAQVEDKAFGHV
jgi:hypothetical protein